MNFWRCEKKDRCKARLHTKAVVVIKKLNDNSHEMSAALVDAALFKSNIKKRTAESLESPTIVMNECLSKV